MPILTPALETETILKTGLELGKLAPMRTDSGLPFTEILTAPLRARVRAEASTGLLRDAVVLDAVVLDGWAVELVPVAPVSAVTCWLNGSLLAKVEKPVSCCFECLGGRSQVGRQCVSGVSHECKITVGGLVFHRRVNRPVTIPW